MKSQSIHIPLNSSTQKTVSLTLIRCPAGQFTVKSLKQTFEIPFAFWISQTPITQDVWQAVMHDNPSSFQGNLHPVENVSWLDCLRFCNALSQLTRHPPFYSLNEKTIEIADPHTHPAFGYRLPTRLEWQYAFYAGQTYQEDLSQLKDSAWYGGGPFAHPQRVQISQTYPVATKKANRWNLHDLQGNVWEWCQPPDASFPLLLNNEDASQRCPIQGGSWRSPASHCHPNYPAALNLSFTSNSLGFRILKRVKVDESSFK